MFWIGLIIGIIGTILLELLYCILTVGSIDDDK